MVIMVFLVLVMGIGSAHAQDRSLYWQQWDVLIDQVNTTQNQFRVTESYVIQFDGRFTFGTASIPLDRVERINAVIVSQDGRALTEAQSCSGAAGTYCVESVNNALDIRYYFRQEIASGRGVFEIQYMVFGGLRVYLDGDQLWWDAIPAEHFDFPIRASTVTVELPDGFAPREGVDSVVTYGAAGDVQVNGTRVTASARNGVGGSEEFSLRVQYPHDPNARKASWQAGFDDQRAFAENVLPLVNLGSIALALVVALGSGFGFYALYNARGRDPQIGPVPEFLSEPPSSLAPAVVGSLIDERADTRDVIATFIDLAHRGYLVIEEGKTEGVFGLGKQSQFTFKRTDRSADDLAPWERTLLSGLFKAGVMERDLSALKETFYQQISKAQQALYQVLVDEGFFKNNPENTRMTYGLIGAGLFGLALFAFFMLMNVFSSEQFMLGPMLLAFSLFVPAIGIVIVAPQMPAKTLKGAEEAAKWKAFYKYMANLEKYDSVEAAKARFEEFLPYAVAFGLDKTWIGAFNRVENMPIPYWYFPTYLGGRRYTPGTALPRYPQSQGFPGGDIARGGGGSLNDLSGGLSGGLESISSGLSDMLNDASRIMTSRPQSSSSNSSGSWRGGGSSWSGGGFSGGGGSGGGSRGFG